ncbi:MAG: putative lycopene beta-cyclase [Actinomycetota bacterium]|jgi:lycopene beta-cyclase
MGRDGSRDRTEVDVAIVGAGPAGLALAHALVARGVDTCVVSPDAPWHATYGAWRDDVETCELGKSLDTLVRGAWPVVRIVGAREHLLERPYVVFDNQRLRTSLATGVVTRNDSVLAAEHDLYATTLRLASGGVIRARLVIDATGIGVLLALRPASRGAQTAYGLVVGDTAHVDAGVFTLMDWRPSTRNGSQRLRNERTNAATFFYGARFNDGTSLIEETSLFAEPPLDINELRGLLASRLGSDLTSQAMAVERVHIPMGIELPSRTTRVVGFGAAAGYVHPVTGYSVASSLRASSRVGDAIAIALQDGKHASDLASAVWHSVWPTHLLSTRAWHLAGLHALRRLQRERIGEFFDEFFSLPVDLWSSYLRIDTEPSVVRQAMFTLFARSRLSLRVKLAASPVALLRALVA